jgi:hypothetical protein
MKGSTMEDIDDRYSEAASRHPFVKEVRIQFSINLITLETRQGIESYTNLRFYWKTRLEKDIDMLKHNSKNDQIT